VTEEVRPLLKRPTVVWIWGAVVIVLNVYMAVYLYNFSRVLAGLFSGGTFTGPLPLWLQDEQTFMLIWLATAASVLTSFALIALSTLHVWKYTSYSTVGKAIWTVVPFFAIQPGLLVYWAWNVARPLLLRVDDGGHSKTQSATPN